MGERCHTHVGHILNPRFWLMNHLVVACLLFTLHRCSARSNRRRRDNANAAATCPWSCSRRCDPTSNAKTFSMPIEKSNTKRRRIGARVSINGRGGLLLTRNGGKLMAVNHGPRFITGRGRMVPRQDPRVNQIPVGYCGCTGQTLSSSAAEIASASLVRLPAPVITMSHRNVQPHVNINEVTCYRTERTLMTAQTPV